jgi:ABC-type Zn uptake system ZnuABC Zn-binding protein ZnuA
MRRFLAAVLLLASSCAGADTGGGDGRLEIVATVSPITNIVANVVGDLATVQGVVPEGENSHEFEPAPSVARVLARADVVFVNGLSLETPTIELARANLKEGAEIVELGPRTVSRDEYIFDFSFPRDAGDPNPHLWTNPPYAKRFAEIVRDVMAERDPANASAYRRNYEAFAERVDALDRALREATASIPRERRKLLTYHDSFPYFAREYGWTVVGAIQPSDFSDPSPREVAAIIRQIRSEGVPAIFGSEVFPSPVLEQIARESGARYVDDLRDDDLPGEPGEAGHTWLALMVFDYRTIVDALGGDPSALEEVDTSNVVPDRASYA